MGVKRTGQLSFAEALNRFRNQLLAVGLLETLFAELDHHGATRPTTPIGGKRR